MEMPWNPAMELDQEAIIALLARACAWTADLMRGTGTMTMGLVYAVAIFVPIIIGVWSALWFFYGRFFMMVRKAFKCQWFWIFCGIVPTVFLFILAVQVHEIHIVRSWVPDQVSILMETWIDPRSIFRKCGACSFNRATCSNDPNTYWCPFVLVFFWFGHVQLCCQMCLECHDEALTKKNENQFKKTFTTRVKRILFVVSTARGDPEVFQRSAQLFDTPEFQDEFNMV